MKTHTQMGYDMLMDSMLEVLRMGALVAMQHQEKRIRRPALRDQQLAAHQILADQGVENLQPLFGTERSKQREVLQGGVPRQCRVRSTHLALPKFKFADQLSPVGTSPRVI